MSTPAPPRPRNAPPRRAQNRRVREGSASVGRRRGDRRTTQPQRPQVARDRAQSRARRAPLARRVERPSTRKRKVAQRQERRLLVLILVVALAFAGIVVRLVQVQVMSPDRFVNFGADVRTRDNIIPAARGSIFDRDGERLVLPDEEVDVAVDPGLLVDTTDRRRMAEDLARVLDGDVEEIFGQLNSDGRYAVLAERVPQDVLFKAGELNEDNTPVLADALTGPHMIIESRPSRLRPSGDLAARVLGSTNKDNRGITGVESHWNHRLTGTDGRVVRERDREDRTIESGVFERIDPVDGEDIFLTLDFDLQLRAEQIVGDHVARLGANWGVAVLTRPETGEVLAMASMDRNPLTGLAEVSPQNRAVTDSFEAGSVMKVVPYAAALHDGRLRIDETIDTPERLTVGGVTIHNSIPQQSGELTAADLVAYSSNTGANIVAMRLGDERYHEWLTKFGFGRRSSLRLPQESRGILKSPDRWVESSAPAHSIGHELTVTPAQLAAAYNVIWNDGNYMPLELLHATQGPDDDEPVSKEQPDAQRTVSVQVAAQMRELLTGVVDFGTASLASVDGYSVAGKTGTARKIITEGELAGTYGNDGYREYVSSFSGALPASDPELAIVVILDNPIAEFSGGKAAAPVFHDLAVMATTELGLTPDRPAGEDDKQRTFNEQAEDEPKVDYTGRSAEDIARQLEIDERRRNAAEQAQQDLRDQQGAGTEPVVDLEVGTGAGGNGGPANPGRQPIDRTVVPQPQATQEIQETQVPTPAPAVDQQPAEGADRTVTRR